MIYPNFYLRQWQRGGALEPLQHLIDKTLSVKRLKLRSKYLLLHLAHGQQALSLQMRKLQCLAYFVYKVATLIAQCCSRLELPELFFCLLQLPSQVLGKVEAHLFQEVGALVKLIPDSSHVDHDCGSVVEEKLASLEDDLAGPRDCLG